MLDVLGSRVPRLGGGHLVCVDGPTGSGKTTLADHLVAGSAGAVAVHTDDLLEGWDGLPALGETLADLLHPLAAGRPGSYRRWDWHAGAWAERVTVAPAPLVVVEGVGSGARSVADLVSLLVWVEAPYDQRRRRGLARDGDDFAPHWERWAEAERTAFAAHRTRERADLVVDAGDPEG